MSAGLQTRGALYAALKKQLLTAEIATPEIDARLLLSAACGVDDVALISAPELEVSRDALQRLEAMVARRLDGEPVSRIVGEREFWGLSFKLNEATLDPRPDSETLIEAVLGVVPDQKRALRILDLGTGSGCLLLALLSEYPNAHGIGVDVSPLAIEAARDNAERLGLLARAQFQMGDWACDLVGPFDIIISNPPYIPQADIQTLSREVKKFDPLTALDGGEDGLEPYRQLMPELARLLSPSGFAVFEFGEGQGPDIASIATSAGIADVRFYADLAGIDRAIMVKL